jgi:predicted MFS family arabinose efflux permease
VSEPAPHTDINKPTRAIVLLGVSAFVSAANIRVCDPLLPQMAAEFGTTIGGVGVAVTAFALAYGLFQIVIGTLGDASGKLRIIVFGGIWAGIATLLSAAMPSLVPHIFARFLAGIGAAAMIPLGIAWIADVIPYQDRQTVLARFASGTILGVVFGQAIGGIVGEIVGWRSTLMLVGIAHIFSALLIARERRRLKMANRPLVAPNLRNALHAASRLFSGSWSRLLLGTAFLEGALMFGTFAYVPSHLQHQFNIGSGFAGGLTGAFGIGALAYSLSAGWLLPRFGQIRLMGVGVVLLAGAFVAMAISPWLALIPVATAVIGLGFYMVHNTLQLEATQLDPQARGLSVAMFAMMLFTGQSIGVAFAGFVVDRWGGAPVFLIAAAGLLIIILWFRRQLAQRTG